MKIHLLSDLHLETGPYQIPADIDCDVIVAAGDIGVGTQGVEWLKTLEKPVVYVLGNHEYWTKKNAQVDMRVILQNIKNAVAGSNVHVLENEFTVINGVRFFGATFWTNLGQFNPILIEEARHINDYAYIYCQSLYQDEVFLSRFFHCAKRYCALTEIEEDQFLRHLHEQYIETGRFHPFVGYLLNQTSWDLIQREILSPYADVDAPYSQTVIVTHHHSSYKSLRLDGVPEYEISPKRMYAPSHAPNGKIYKTAAYASDLKLTGNYVHEAKEPKIAAWLCGHLHRKMDYAHDGSRIVCNPRGYRLSPMSAEIEKLYALFGFPASQDSIEESQRRFAENPFLGNGIDFDPRLVIDLRDGVIPYLRREIEPHIQDLTRLHEEIREFASCMDATNEAVLLALRECINTRANEFAQRVRELDELVGTNTNMRPGFVSELLNNPASAISDKNAEMIAKQNKTLQKLHDWMSGKS